MAYKKSSRKRQLPNSHEQRVYDLGSLLLDTLAKDRECRLDEKLKSLGWSLISFGESLEKGSLQKAREMELEIKRGSVVGSTTLGIGLCLIGDQLMDWSTLLLLRDKANIGSR